MRVNPLYNTNSLTAVTQISNLAIKLKIFCNVRVAKFVFALFSILCLTSSFSSCAIDLCVFFV